MCRLFASLARNPGDASFPLSLAPQSLLRQSHVDSKRLQGDGWGVGWTDSGRPRILKSAKPMYKDVAAVRRAGRQARSELAMGHVRWASNPMKLPRPEIIGPLHTQPFSHGRWLFVHNGTLQIPREVSAALGSGRKFIQGHNDSEVLFYWLLKYLEPLLVGEKTLTVAQAARAVRRSLKGLDALWNKYRKRYPLYRYAYHGVNWVLSDGTILLAFCFTDPAGFSKGKSLINPRQPYFQMQWRSDREHLTVASEPLDFKKPWTAFRHGQLLLGRRTAQGITVQLAQAA